MNVVEVDLVRRGNWRRLLLPHECPPRHVTPYRVTIRTPRDPDSVFLQPVPLRAPVPAVNVPLRADDPPVRLDVQPLLDRFYEANRYARRTDYRQDPVPPLDADNAAWADALLRAAGKR